MFPMKYPVPQSDPPKSPRETLPSMYDLPSENPEEPGLPDEFHDWQAQLLSLTFCPPYYPAAEVFCASDMNLYYDVRHALWYKRPDWFGVVGVPRLYDQVDMRLSYVVWQEGVNPFVVVELLSPGTEKEDLGELEADRLPDEPSSLEGNGQAIESQSTQTQSKDKPPRKWQVYEQILRIPYYIVFSRYTNQLRVFKLEGACYQELELPESRVWMKELGLGLGLWQGEFQGIERLWLRWYDAEGNWILTEAEQERQRAEEAESKLESLLRRLRESGIDPDTFLEGEQ
ncbi:Uma2 family endonuclease [Coleofasciculus sp. G2-EDA-02]|uniref:Uma2 family endonuclease n=1 Tax=Coleofasciculus sp. G2-EDA-02 TaxID=3069529 RepID=UPI0033020B55